MRKLSATGLIVALLAVGAGSSGYSADAASHRPASPHEPTLFMLRLNKEKAVISVPTSGKSPTTLLPDNSALNGPDGIAVDAARGHLYWTNMGKVGLDDGSIMRANLDGSQLQTIVPAAGTFTPKQLKLDATHGKLYWSDREGMRVMRANLDGTRIETLVITGSGDVERKDAARWCVGIAVDEQQGKLYWTQKGGDNASKGTIKRANLEIPAGETASTRSDIEVLFADLPEPIDLDLDEARHLLYWTDRGDNTISRARIDVSASSEAARRQILVRDVGEAIGLALDLRRGQLYYTTLGGVVGTAALDGGKAREILTGSGALTGIVLVDPETH